LIHQAGLRVMELLMEQKVPIDRPRVRTTDD
jgi:hypothetical protein